MPADVKRLLFYYLVALFMGVLCGMIAYFKGEFSGYMFIGTFLVALFSVGAAAEYFPDEEEEEPE